MNCLMNSVNSKVLTLFLPLLSVHTVSREIAAFFFILGWVRFSLLLCVVSLCVHACMTVTQSTLPHEWARCSVFCGMRLCD